jgi:hypothetical protein
VNPGTWACAKLIGDDFELEDQRNNFDASFKTYSRSNQAPRPYVIHAGTVIEQTMMLSLKNDQGHHASLPSIAAEPCPARVQLEAQALSMPLLGVGLRASDTHLISDLLPHGLALKCRHWHLVLNHPEEEVNWNQVAQLCRATQASLRIDVGGIPHAGESNWFEELALRLQHEDLLPESIGVLSDNPLIFEQARHAFPCSRIGVGTPHFFVQLNRMKGLPKADFSTFTTSSLVHGADDDHIMLGLQSTPGIFETLQHTHAAQAMRVGPSFIAARRSPLGEQPATDGSRRVVLASTDPRDRSVFGAIWAAAYFSIFARHGAQSISLFYLTGASGLIHEQDARAACSPAFHLLALLNECDHMRAGRVDGNKHLYACALKHSGHTRLLLVNTSPEACQVNAAEWGRPTGCLIMDTQSVRNMLQTGAASTWRAGPIPDEQLLMGGYTMVLLTL